MAINCFCPTDRRAPLYLGSGSPHVSASTLDRGSAALTADCVFTWGEHNYADLLTPGAPPSQTYAPYYYRHYPATNSYVGVSSADSHLYFMGIYSNNQMLDLGAIATWKQTAKCQ